MTSDSRLVLPLIESSDLSDEDRKLVKAILWRDGATPAITTHEQYIRYQRIRCRALPQIRCRSPKLAFIHPIARWCLVDLAGSPHAGLGRGGTGKQFIARMGTGTRGTSQPG